MRFAFILATGSLFGAGAVSASQCRPSHSPSSSSSSIPSSSVSSSSAAVSSSAPPKLPPCYSNLLGSNYHPSDVDASTNIAISFPASCPNAGPNSCVNFVDTNGQAGTFSFSITVPTVPGAYYDFYTYIHITAASPSPNDKLTCTVSNSVSTASLALQTGYQPEQLNFLSGAGSSSTVTCSGTVSTALDLTASAFSIISTDPNVGCA
ncbi:hypothetical protein SBRCBS47491_008876 [Sporothrix bragantina]|uniref:Ubiquitin 3 binding protein But2 C-terminal domain-containing protein n=1 Tax=Sporothrix bragantina TaxID=671064 RepID=A0ABP0CSD7_9PEZI